MRILVYPDKIVPSAKFWYLCERLGIEITRNIDSDFDMGLFWSKKSDSFPDEKLIKVSLKKKIINIKLNCVLKSYIDKAWEEASGYSITIDPMDPPDFYVRKSQLQFRSHTGEVHDGRIFTNPQEPDERYVYQKLIGNIIQIKNEVFYRVLRVPVFKENIPCLYIKDQPHRFKKSAGDIIINVVNVLKYIGKDEIKVILKFCKILGVEYAELDLLRDRDGKLYGIDVNNLVGDGVFLKLSETGSIKLQEILAKTFKKEFL